MDAVLAESLKKVYRSKGRMVEALRGVDLRVRAGILFSFLGRNGAGKTTFVRIASTLLLPTSGVISVMGYDAVSEPYRVRELLAVVPQGIHPYWHLTPREHIYHYLRFREWSRTEARARAEEIIHDMGMEPFSDTPGIMLSGGQKQRTMVATILATQAPILFLDEPTIGMDPVARRQVWSVIEKARKAGSTVFLTTHYLDEAERLSEEIAVINEGLVLYAGNIEGMKSRLQAEYRAVLKSDVQMDLTSYGTVVRDGARQLVLTSKESAMELAKEAGRLGIEISIGPVTLEEAFLQLAGGYSEEQAD